MPKGRTRKGVEADGAVVLIYYQNLFLMGQETSYITDSDDFNKRYKDSTGKSIDDDFLSPGSKENAGDLLIATTKFSQLCLDLEGLFPEIPRITFADVRNSRSNPGFIAAKPRYVVNERRQLFGFPKGSYEHKDGLIDITGIRECDEETTVVLSHAKLQDTNNLVPTGRGTHYSVYHYKLTKKEYEDALLLIAEKNQSRDNELQNLQFLKVPAVDPRRFFINVVSKEAYERTIKKGGSRKTLRSRVQS